VDTRFGHLHALRTIRDEGDVVIVIDQTQLPHRLIERRLTCLEDAAEAIRAMQVRGAPLIGAAAAYGVALALRRDAGDASLERALATLAATRPTAVNLHWAIARMRERLAPVPPAGRAHTALNEARALCAEGAATNHAIGEHGLALIEALVRSKRRRVNVMTHCNAGWLATVAYGTALAPVYAAQASGIETHVLVSETRPRNQGLLTAWELRQAGVPHTLVADNAAGYLMRQGAVDLVIVGADRIAANGDAANKVGTYLKALAAQDNGVPFYVAAPGSTIDWECPEGDAIPIENRSGDELRSIVGLDSRGRPARVQLAPGDTGVDNPAFDVTPARLITGMICERGTLPPNALRAAFEPVAPMHG
jgi:methylthioribose-1-phosphate isomerase